MSLKKRITIILFLLGVLVLTKLTFGKTQTEKQDTLDVWIEKLAVCESNSDNTAVNYDDGEIGSHSYGMYQWKVPTAGIWVKKVGLLDNWENLEYEDKANWLMDKEFSTELTTRVLRENRYNSVLWKNCTNKLGTPPLWANTWWSQG
jgi:hypothetical protein